MGTGGEVCGRLLCLGLVWKQTWSPLALHSWKLGEKSWAWDRSIRADAAHEKIWTLTCLLLPPNLNQQGWLGRWAGLFTTGLHLVGPAEAELGERGRWVGAGRAAGMAAAPCQQVSWQGLWHGAWYPCELSNAMATPSLLPSESQADLSWGQPGPAPQRGRKSGKLRSGPGKLIQYKAIAMIALQIFLEWTFKQNLPHHVYLMNCYWMNT